MTIYFQQTDTSWKAIEVMSVTGATIINLEEQATWDDNTPIYYKQFNGSAPDIGALEADPSLTITVTASDATSTEEGTTTGTFTIACSPNCAGETINYTLTGTATLNDDYNLANGEDVEDGTITITGANDVITLTPVDDAVVEAEETVTLTIISGSYTIDSPSTADITITDNDDPGPPVGGGDITLSGGSITITPDNGGSLTITINPSP